MSHRAVAAIVVSLTVAVASVVSAEPPKSIEVRGFSLGVTAEEAGKTMKELYRRCSAKLHMYEVAGSTSDLAYMQLAEYADCYSRLNVPDAGDLIGLRFAPRIFDPRGRLYEVFFLRGYDAPKVTAKAISYPFEEVERALFEKYGKPVATSRKPAELDPRTVSMQIADGQVRPTDSIETTYTFTSAGKPLADCESNSCADQVSATITAERSKATKPANVYYVMQLHIWVTDQDMSRKVEAWRATAAKVENKAKKAF